MAVIKVDNKMSKEELVSNWNDLSEHTDYVRGLILTEAKRDCDENSSLSWENYLKDFMVGGKSVAVSYATRLLQMTKEKVELKKVLRSSADNQLNNLEETEATLTLPDSASTQMELRGENAIQKARNYQEVKEAVGKDKPSAGDIRTYNQAKAKAKESMDKTQTFDKEAFDEATKNAKKITTKDDKPDYFTAEEEIDFESWCIKVHSFNVVEMKPKGVRAVFALKDNNVDTLLGRVDEWKSAKKIMAKLCHPDTGGNELAMSMLNDFSELMKSLSKIKDIIDYDNRVEELKREYSTPSS